MSFCAKCDQISRVHSWSGEVRPDPKKIEAIRSFTKPSTKKSMRSFLGLLNFYRKFVPNLAKHVASLTDLLKKSMPDKICWTVELNELFEILML